MMREPNKIDASRRIRLRLLDGEGSALGFLPSIMHSVMHKITPMKKLSNGNHGILFELSDVHRDWSTHWFITPRVLLDDESGSEFRPGVEEVLLSYHASIPDEILEKLASVDFSMEKYLDTGDTLFVQCDRPYEEIAGMKIPVVLDEKDVIIVP